MFDVRYYVQLSQFFNTSVLKDVADRQDSPYINDTIKDSGYIKQVKGFTFRNLFESVYDVLENHYRCEYVYKNTLANKLLLANHSLSESTLISEFSIGGNRADTIILNGNATIYEIKTELDSLARLPKQIESYFHLAPYVNVVTHLKHVSKLEKSLPQSVGIVCLEDDSSLITIRKSTFTCDFLSNCTMFDTLRRKEYTEIVKNEFGFIPEVPNTRIYTECRKLFCQLEPMVAYRHLVAVLRKRNQSNHFQELIDNMPYSLKMTCFQSNMTKKQWGKLLQSLDQTAVPA